VFSFGGNRSFTVTVNGTPVTLEGEHTLTSLVNGDYTQPHPGNLLAVDGTVFREGDGHRFSAVVNGKTVEDLNQRLKNGEIIIISDGGDTYEPYEETVETVPFEIIEEGSGPIRIFEGEGVDGSRIARIGSLSGLTVYVDTMQVFNVSSTSFTPNVGEEKVIALTFSGGPSSKTTEQILDVLAANDAKATFFVVGQNIDKNRESIIKRIDNEGHQIGNNTYSHASDGGNGSDLSSMPYDKQIEDMRKGFESISQALGRDADRIFRAPDGNFAMQTQRLLAPHITAEIGWTIDSGDAKASEVSTIVLQIESAGPGSIILLHDGEGDRSHTVEALEIALPHLKEKGFRFATIGELMNYG
jgi:peptidoglycan/xylan/chitin deacetylase (PgdA/CDA1 family)